MYARNKLRADLEVRNAVSGWEVRGGGLEGKARQSQTGIRGREAHVSGTLLMRKLEMALPSTLVYSRKEALNEGGTGWDAPPQSFTELPSLSLSRG